MMEYHVTDETMKMLATDEEKRFTRELWDKALKGDKSALEELLEDAYAAGYSEAYG